MIYTTQMRHAFINTDFYGKNPTLVGKIVDSLVTGNGIIRIPPITFNVITRTYREMQKHGQLLS